MHADPQLARSTRIERFFQSRLRLGQLRLLVAIADLGQLKRVAAALHVTPPAISKQVAELEEALGEPLLVRVGNRLAFTPLGELLARRARELMAQIERTRADVDRLCSGMSGRMAIGAVPTVAPLLLPELVLTLKQRAPGVSIELYEYHFERLAPMLASGEVDLVLARETTHALNHDFEEREVMADPLAVCCGVQHPLAKRASLRWQDLAHVAWILPGRRSSTFQHLEALLLRHGLVVPEGSIESMSWSANAELLRGYPFVTLFPLAHARRLAVQQRICMLPLSTSGMQGMIKAVWRRGNDHALLPGLLEALQQHVRWL